MFVSSIFLLFLHAPPSKIRSPHRPKTVSPAPSRPYHTSLPCHAKDARHRKCTFTATATYSTIHNIFISPGMFPNNITRSTITTLHPPLPTT
ncbi:hypothetical protein PF008_g25208 [Phytophthora fragariae]|uniref:RxLR effector protein n=1 Tax=Phytophthora fragariae TaxID=53985 RepID=A0A6G0QKN2_9STRA|nr:hypothetical protein PF008_g25208 [Phytophthora fragariae]